MPDPNQFDYQQAYRNDPGPNFGSGLLSGVLGYKQQSLLREEQEMADTRTRALEWLKSIPQTEHNLPIVTKLALDVMSSKPTTRRFSDLFKRGGSGDQTHQFIDDIYSKLRAVLPQTGALGPEMGVGGEGVPSFQSNVTPLATGNMSTDWALRKPPSLGGPATPEPLADTSTEFPIGRPQRPQLQTVAKKTGPQPGILEFPQQGRFKPGPVFTDSEGNTFGLSFDERTGRYIKSENFGTGLQTEKERIAGMQARVKLELADQAEQKGLMKDVLAHAAADRLTPQAFRALSAQEQLRYYQKAGVGAELAETSKRFLESTAAQRNIQQAGFYSRMPVAPASTETGLTPNQALIDTRDRETKARAYNAQFIEARAKALALRKQLDTLKASTPPFMQTGVLGQEFMAKYGALEADYNQALRTAQDMAANATIQHKGFLTGGTDAQGLPTITFANQDPARPTFKPTPRGGETVSLPAASIGGIDQFRANVGRFTNLTDPKTGQQRKAKVVSVDEANGTVTIQWQ